MVYGIKVFTERFKNYSNSFVLIGGTACSLILEDMGLEFRATNDIDIVLLLENPDYAFFQAFWSFLDEGGYENYQKCSDGNQYYRFDSPKTEGYPKIIELLCRRTIDLNPKLKQHITPIHIDDSIRSLSAIVINDEYYKLLKTNLVIINEIPVLKPEIIILLKIRAWIELNEHRSVGVNISYKNINKHKNDTLRLIMALKPDVKVIGLSDFIRNDVIFFVRELRNQTLVLKDLNIRNISQEELIEQFELVYLS